MKNMKVKTRLLVSFIVMAILSATVGTVGIFSIRMLNNCDSAMFDFIPSLDIVGDLRENYQRIRADVRELSTVCAFEDPSSMNTILDSVDTHVAAFRKTFEDYEGEAYDMAIEANFYNCVDTFEKEYIPFLENLKSTAKTTRDSAAVYTVLKNAAPIAAKIEGYLEATSKDNTGWGYDLNQSNNATADRAMIIQLVILLATVAIALIFAFHIAALISKPLAVLTGFMKKAGTTGDISLSQIEKDNMNKYSQTKDEIGQTIGATSDFLSHVTEIGKNLEIIAGGDLTASVKTLSDSDTMGLSLKTMLNNLNNMFIEINTATVQVSAGSKQIADGAQALAAGSTEQASSVQELAASLGDVSTKTNENAKMAKEASGLSTEIKNNAEKGSVQMEQMMTAVTEINDASGSISKVIKVIDDIAFQTNILALNAAVEAARAGQHGKGFAVVAEEVRNLAAKSAEAAKDTSSLIENSIEKANFGLTIATETSESLHDIVEGINRNAEIIVKIENSSEEQSRAITQINVGIDQVAQVVQQNSATAEESAAASEEMSGQANLLEQLIAQFKLRDSSTGKKLETKSYATPKEINKETPKTITKPSVTNTATVAHTPSARPASQPHTIAPIRRTEPDPQDYDFDSLGINDKY